MQNSEIYCIFQSSDTLYQLKSKVNKEETVCKHYDYKCIFWKTDQEFSDKQMACYTPPIPVRDRLKFKDPHKFILYIRANNVDYTCKNKNDCSLVYDPWRTGRMLSIIPQHLTYGTQVQMRLVPYRNYGTDNPGINNPVENNIKNIKVGINNCIFPTIFNNEQPLMKNVIEANSKGPNSAWHASFNCLVNDGVPELIAKEGFLLNFVSGVPTIPTKVFQQDLRGKDYIFKLFPKVDTVSQKTVSIYGETEITLTGRGFVQGSFSERLQVFLDNNENPCKVTKIINTEVKCKTSPVSKSLLKRIDAKEKFIGSPGFRYRKFELKEWFETVPGDAKPVAEDIKLEIRSTMFQSVGIYQEVYDGYLKIPKNAQYRFFVASDDKSAVFLTIDGVRTKVLNAPEWSPLEDYTRHKSNMGKWLTLKAGYYYMEAFYMNLAGGDGFTMGLLMKEEGDQQRFLIGKSKNLMSYFRNKSKKIFKYFRKPT